MLERKIPHQCQVTITIILLTQVSLVGAGGQTVSLLSSPGGHGGRHRHPHHHLHHHDYHCQDNNPHFLSVTIGSWHDHFRLNSRPNDSAERADIHPW